MRGGKNLQADQPTPNRANVGGLYDLIPSCHDDDHRYDS